jgi:hypothetical protein
MISYLAFSGIMAPASSRSFSESLCASADLFGMDVRIFDLLNDSGNFMKGDKELQEEHALLFMEEDGYN